MCSNNNNNNLYIHCRYYYCKIKDICISVMLVILHSKCINISTEFLITYLPISHYFIISLHNTSRFRNVVSTNSIHNYIIPMRYIGIM